MKKDPSKLIYYGAWGVEHTTTCFWCGEEVFMSFRLTPEESRKKLAGCVHHLDHDHSNNDLRNLAGMHYGCHIAYHRSIRPLVAKGSTLPEEWRTNIVAGIKKRYKNPKNREITSKAASKYIRSTEAFQEDLYCIRCRGRFSGIWGINQHHKRGVCTPQTGDYECACGRKFTLNRGLVRHRKGCSI